MPPCRARGCHKRAYALDLCDPHYRRLRSTGDIWEDVPLYADGRSHPGDISRESIFRFHDLTVFGDVPEVDPTLGVCILWTGATKDDRYGRFHHDGWISYAHRFAWEAERGALPDWLVLDHLCCVPTCVRVSHLEPVTVIENSRRGGKRTRMRRSGRTPAETDRSEPSDSGGA